MSEPVDAIVIGAGIGGLAAAICLRKAGAEAVLLEAEEPGGGAGAMWPVLDALDPSLVKSLKLTRRGLKFEERDLPTLSLRLDGRHLLLPRDPQRAARAIVAHSPEDARAYERRHAEMFALARRLRPWWWESANAPAGLPARLAAVSAQALVNSWFESEAFRATLLFDAPKANQPGSALALIWHAAQEMCGLQGARAIAQGGGVSLVDALMAAAKDEGVTLRSKARVTSILLGADEAVGVVLASGEQIFARTVVSSLSRRETVLKLLPAASAGIAETLRLLSASAGESETLVSVTLNGEPGLSGRGTGAMRYVVTEGEPALEAVSVGGPVPGQHRLVVRARGTAPAEAIVARLERFSPHLGSRILDASRRMHTRCHPKLAASASARISTPIRNLFLCGRDAEPLDSLSGRAGRLAAAMAMTELQRMGHR